MCTATVSGNAGTVYFPAVRLYMFTHGPAGCAEPIEVYVFGFCFPTCDSLSTGFPEGWLDRRRLRRSRRPLLFNLQAFVFGSHTAWCANTMFTPMSNVLLACFNMCWLAAGWASWTIPTPTHARVLLANFRIPAFKQDKRIGTQIGWHLVVPPPAFEFPPSPGTNKRTGGVRGAHGGFRRQA